jgi:hypothetical protein
MSSNLSNEIKKRVPKSRETIPCLNQCGFTAFVKNCRKIQKQRINWASFLKFTASFWHCGNQIFNFEIIYLWNYEVMKWNEKSLFPTKSEVYIFYKDKYTVLGWQMNLLVCSVGGPRKARADKNSRVLSRVDTKRDFFNFAKYEINTKKKFISRNFVWIILRNFAKFRKKMLRNFAKLNHDLKKSSTNVTFFHLEASYGYNDEILYQVPIITSVAELHHFYVAPDPAPSLLYDKATFFKRTKV